MYNNVIYGYFEQISDSTLVEHQGARSMLGSNAQPLYTWFESNEVFLQTACLVFSHLFIQYLLCCWSSIEREKHSPCPFQVLTQPGTWIKRRLWVEFDEKYVLAVQFLRRYLPGASVGGIVFVFSIVKTSVVVVVGVVVVVVGFVLLESIAT